MCICALLRNKFNIFKNQNPVSTGWGLGERQVANIGGTVGGAEAAGRGDAPARSEGGGKDARGGHGEAESRRRRERGSLHWNAKVTEKIQHINF